MTSGDPAGQIVAVAREGGFDLIIMPTHSGRFRQMLLESTTAKVLDLAERPVMTTAHTENMTARPLAQTAFRLRH